MLSDVMRQMKVIITSSQTKNWWKSWMRWKKNDDTKVKVVKKMKGKIITNC